MIPPLIRHKIFDDGHTVMSFIYQQRAQKRSIVFTNGCFDLLHPGHIYCLTEAKLMGDVLIVGLNTDASVFRLKGADRPVNDQSSRAVVLAAMAAVDAVVFFDDDTPLGMIEAIRPDVLVKGAEYSTDQMDGADFVRSYGGDIVRIPMLPGYSSTTIINKLQ